jgi:tetratricopeptide (TPR) repeat protein
MKKIKIALVLLLLLTVSVGCGKQKKINEFVSQGNEAYKIEDYTTAIEAFTSALELDDELETVYNNRGMAYMNQGEYDLAIADFSSAITLNPDEDVYYYNRGLTYTARGLWSKAKQDFTSALTIRGELVYYIGRADAERALTDAEAAIKDYSAALAIEPDNLIALNNRGALYFDTGEYEKAIVDYQRALQQEELSDEDEITLYWNLAEAERLSESYEAAANTYELYLTKTDTENVAALKAMAQCQEAEGLYEELLTTYNRLMAVDPDDIEAYQGRGDAYYQLQEYSKAAEDYTVVLNAQEDYVNYALRGYCYYQLEEYDLALEDLTASITLNDGYAWAYYVRGTVYKAQSEYKAAQADLEKAVELETSRN